MKLKSLTSFISRVLHPLEVLMTLCCTKSFNDSSYSVLLSINCRQLLIKPKSETVTAYVKYFQTWSGSWASITCSKLRRRSSLVTMYLQKITRHPRGSLARLWFHQCTSTKDGLECFEINILKLSLFFIFPMALEMGLRIPYSWLQWWLTNQSQRLW